jgi:hypothetical protein
VASVESVLAIASEGAAEVHQMRARAPALMSGMERKSAATGSLLQAA